MGNLAWPLLLLGLAIVLLMAEVFLPSGGVIGLLAIGCLVISLWTAFSRSLETGVAFLLADTILLPVATMLAMYLWPKTPFAKRIFLKPPTAEELLEVPANGRVEHFLGQMGTALTPLRPSGLVEIDGRKFDCESEGTLIPRGALVEAVRVRGGRLVVRETRPSEISGMSP